MPSQTPQSLGEIEAAAHDFGVAPGGRAMILAELDAAETSIATGVYVVWRTNKTGESAAGVQKDGQCCRLGPNSRCFCGHSLSEHKAVKQGNPQAPACTKCKCRRFNYVPMRPEECGMWHLPRRKGFNVHLWRAPCKCKCGHDAHDPVTLKCNGCNNCARFEPNYCCIGCDGRGDQHETVFETESERVLAKLPVGEAYKPLQDSPYLLQQVVEGRQRTEFTSGGAKGGRGAGRPRAAAAPAASPEELLERGKIDIAEYRRLIALPPSGGSSSSRDGGGGTLMPASGGEIERLGSGRGPTGREYAQKGATVKQISLDVGGGESIEVFTNLGRPMPQPGKDFSRPWEPAPPRRPHPLDPRNPARKEPARPVIEELSPRAASQRSLATANAVPRSAAGAGGGGGSSSSCTAPGAGGPVGSCARGGKAVVAAGSGTAAARASTGGMCESSRSDSVRERQI